MVISVGFSVFVLVLLVKEASCESPEWTSFCGLGEPIRINNWVDGKGRIQHEPSLLGKNWLIGVNPTDSAIVINMTSFVLEDHFLVISEGEDIRANFPQSMIQMISGSSELLEEPLVFKVPLAKSFYLEICPEGLDALENNIPTRGQFDLHYYRDDPLRDDEPLPDEDPNIQKRKESYEIQFYGKGPDQFGELSFLGHFKTAVKIIAKEYCITNKINFTDGRPADEMVSIQAIHKCPFEWPDQDKCASVQHSVFTTDSVGLNGRLLQEFELTAEHLKEMWIEFDPHHLDSLNISIYKLPEKESIIGFWFLIIVLPAVIFIFTTFFGWKLYRYVFISRKISTSVPSSEVAVEKPAKTKLRPNRYQTIPSFFSNQNENLHSRVKQKRDSMDGIPEGERSFYASVLFSRHKLPVTDENLQN